MTVGKYVGRNRASAVWRIVALLILLSVGWIVLLIGALAAFAWMVIDVILAILLNRRLSKGGRGSEWLERLYYWAVDILDWIFFGAGSFPWMP